MTGEELKDYRLSLGLNQSQFAEIIGMNRIATVADYEAGKREVPRSVELLIRYRMLLEEIKKKIENNL